MNSHTKPEDHDNHQGHDHNHDHDHGHGHHHGGGCCGGHSHDHAHDHDHDDDEALEQGFAVVEALQAELAEAKDKMLRAVAEAENTRRRSERTLDDTRKYAVSGFARDLLDVADNLRRALEAVTPEQRAASPELQALLAGVEATEKGMLQTFERQGIKKIEPRDGKFDPNLHEVMFEAEGTGKPAGEIVQLLEAGYVIHDRLLRPARVGVAKAGAGEARAEKIDQSV